MDLTLLYILDFLGGSVLRKLTYIANIFLLVMFAVAQQPTAPVAHPGVRKSEPGS